MFVRRNAERPTLNIQRRTFCIRFSVVDVRCSRERGSAALHLIPETLLMPMRPHALAALVLGNFCFPSFFKRAHSNFSKCNSIESSNSPQCKRSRRFGYLVSCVGPAAAFFLSCVPMPIFFKNGSIDCLRPRNFSIDSLTSRESPGS